MAQATSVPPKVEQQEQRDFSDFLEVHHESDPRGGVGRMEPDRSGVRSGRAIPSSAGRLGADPALRSRDLV